MIHECDRQTDTTRWHIPQLCIASRGKIRHFYVPRPSFFWFALGTPLWQSRKTLHKWRHFSACQTPRSMYPSIFNSFRVIWWLSQCVSPKIDIFTYRRPLYVKKAAHSFVSPGDAPAIITQYVAWMERQFRACQTPRSMYPSIRNDFPVIRTASAKNCCFHVLQPTFLFPLETPLRLSCNMLHEWKDNSMLAKPIAACTGTYLVEQPSATNQSIQ